MMPQNKKESLIFTLMMCAFMAFCMGYYAQVREMGEIGLKPLMNSWLTFPLTNSIAFVLNWYAASPLARKLAGAVLSHEGSGKAANFLAMPFCRTILMVLGMSLYGAIVASGNHGGLAEIPKNYLIGIPLNFMVAFPLQLAVAGPLVRFLFRKAFPVGTLV